MWNGPIGLIAQLNKNRRCRGLNNVDQMLPQFFRNVNLFQMTMKTFLKLIIKKTLKWQSQGSNKGAF
ncbi:unnamed protein product [Brassica rapa]|uniref:Uncharacterized protein n=1 Tax=Brassica campestris TaxID=3711 RepID=A0A8D9GX72_BRACM|nr:unnamed protein product [Brassica rapa]